MRCVTFLVCCLMAATALSAEPVAKITCNRQVPKQGDLLRLDSSDSTPTEANRKWEVFAELTGNDQEVRENEVRMAEDLLASGRWDVVERSNGKPPGYESADNERRLYLPTYPGKYHIMLAITTANEVDPTKPLIDTEQYEITILPACPPPVPPVPPTNPPVPPTNPPVPPTEPPPSNPGKFGLTVSAAKWLETVPPDLRHQKAAVRGACQAVGNKAVAGQYATPAQVEAAFGEALKEVNRQGAIDALAWRVFGNDYMNPAIAGLKSTGKIKTAADYGQALLEIGEGLK